MQPDAGRQPGVDVGHSDVEPPVGEAGETHREPAHLRLVPEGDGRPFQPVATVDPHRVGRVDQHVGHVGVGEHAGERAGAGELSLDPAHHVQRLGRAEPAASPADGVLQALGQPGVDSGLPGELAADGVDQVLGDGGAHAAALLGLVVGSSMPANSAAQSRASGPRGRPGGAPRA